MRAPKMSITNSNSEWPSFHCCVVAGAALEEAIANRVWDLARKLSREEMLLVQLGRIDIVTGDARPGRDKTCICLLARLRVTPKPTTLHPSIEGEAHAQKN